MRVQTCTEVPISRRDGLSTKHIPDAEKKGHRQHPDQKRISADGGGSLSKFCSCRDTAKRLKEIIGIAVLKTYIEAISAMTRA